VAAKLGQDPRLHLLARERSAVLCRGMLERMHAHTFCWCISMGRGGDRERDDGSVMGEARTRAWRVVRESDSAQRSTLRTVSATPGAPRQPPNLGCPMTSGNLIVLSTLGACSSPGRRPSLRNSPSQGIRAWYLGAALPWVVLRRYECLFGRVLALPR